MARTMKVSESGSVTLPAAIRRELGIEPGAQLTPVVKGRVITLVPTVDIRELRGTAVGADMSFRSFRDGH